MKYYIGFSKSKYKVDVVSKTIQSIEGSEFSHVYMKYYIPEYDEWVIYHATNTLIHLLPEERFLERNEIVYEYEFEMETNNYREMAKRSFKKLGLPYGWIQIIGMLFTRLIYLWFSLKVRNPFRDGARSQICSELVHGEMKRKEHGIDFEGFRPEWDGPKKLHTYIKKHGKLVEE